jgi:myosin heavy subunit
MNFCAEKVQQLQVRYLFKNEEAICLAEGISAEEFHYQDNANVVQDLFERQHVGFFALLDDASKYPRETDSGFMKRCVANLEGDVFHRVNADVATYQNPEQRTLARKATESLFSITHFNGDAVVYNVHGFLDKNRNYYYGLPQDVMEMFGHSSNAIMASAFHSGRAGGGSSSASNSPSSSPSARQALGIRARKSMGTLVKNMRSKLRVVFESLSFGDQYFVQCLRPNLAQKDGFFSPHLVNQSLHVYGVLDCVQHRGVGFEWHGKYKNFIMRFLPIVKGNDYLRWPRPPGVTKKSIGV